MSACPFDGVCHGVCAKQAAAFEHVIEGARGFGGLRQGILFNHLVAFQCRNAGFIGGNHAGCIAFDDPIQECGDLFINSGSVARKGGVVGLSLGGALIPRAFHHGP